MPGDSPYGYSIAVEKRDVVVRFSKDIVDWEALTRFLDFLELETIRKRSKLTEAQAIELADEIDRDVWQNIKPKYVGE